MFQLKVKITLFSFKVPKSYKFLIFLKEYKAVGQMKNLNTLNM